MNPTLKSLLITSALTLTSVFGAACAPSAEDGQTPSADPSTSAVVIGGGLIPDSVVITLFGDSASLTRGFLGPAVQRKCRGVHSEFNTSIESTLSMVDRWKNTFDIKSLFAEGRLNEGDANVIAFLGANPNRLSFEDIMKVAFEIELWDVRISPDKLRRVHDLIDSNPRFRDDEKTIFKGLLPDATPKSIKSTAKELARFGLEYNDRAVRLLERAADRKDVTVDDIMDSVLEFGELGGTHLNIAATYLEQLSDEQLSTPKLIHYEFYSFFRIGIKLPLGSQQREKLLNRAETMYERFVNHPTANPMNFIVRADLMSFLQPEYTHKAVELYLLAATHREADILDVRLAASGLKRLGLNELAKELYQKAEELRKELNVQIQTAMRRNR